MVMKTKIDMKKLLMAIGIASLLSVPMAFALKWAIEMIDSHTFTCPASANFCVLYPFGQGNGFPSYTIGSGQSVNSVLVSRTIVYPWMTTTTTTTTTTITTTTTTTETPIETTTTTTETTTTTMQG